MLLAQYLEKQEGRKHLSAYGPTEIPAARELTNRGFETQAMLPNGGNFHGSPWQRRAA